MDPVAGHIPGALSAPRAATSPPTAASCRPTTAGPLRRPRRRRAPMASYCGSGVTAAHQILALEVAGFEAALYADSWSGWITDPTRPVATGAEPG